MRTCNHHKADILCNLCRADIQEVSREISNSYSSIIYCVVRKCLGISDVNKRSLNKTIKSLVNNYSKQLTVLIDYGLHELQFSCFSGHLQGNMFFMIVMEDV